jgi:hypothetical protein
VLKFAIRGDFKLFLFNFIQWAIPTWLMLELVRWQNEHPRWRHCPWYPPRWCHCPSARNSHLWYHVQTGSERPTSTLVWSRRSEGWPLNSTEYFRPPTRRLVIALRNRGNFTSALYTPQYSKVFGLWFESTPIPRFTNVIRSMKIDRKVKIRKSEMKFPLISM